MYSPQVGSDDEAPETGVKCGIVYMNSVSRSQRLVFVYYRYTFFKVLTHDICIGVLLGVIIGRGDKSVTKN